MNPKNLFSDCYHLEVGKTAFLRLSFSSRSRSFGLASLVGLSLETNQGICLSAEELQAVLDNFEFCRRSQDAGNSGLFPPNPLGAPRRARPSPPEARGEWRRGFWDLWSPRASLLIGTRRKPGGVALCALAPTCGLRLHPRAWSGIPAPRDSPAA